MKHQFLFARGDLIIGEINEFVLHLGEPKALFAFTTALDRDRLKYIDKHPHKEYETEFGDYVVVFMPFSEYKVDPYYLMDRAVEWYMNFLGDQDEFPFIRDYKIEHEGKIYKVTPYLIGSIVEYSTTVDRKMVAFRANEDGKLVAVNHRLPTSMNGLLEQLALKIESAIM